MFRLVFLFVFFLTSQAMATTPVRRLVYETSVGNLMSQTSPTFFRLLTDQNARREFGANRLDEARLAAAVELVHFVRTIDHQQVLVFTLRVPDEHAVTVDMRIENFTEIMDAANHAQRCRLEDKWMMPTWERYTNCYSDRSIYRRTNLEFTVPIIEIGDRFKLIAEYLIADAGLSSDIAVFAQGLQDELKTMRETLYFHNDQFGRGHFPPLLLRSKGFKIDLSAQNLWTPDSDQTSIELIRLVAAAHYLKSKGRVFIDRNHKCRKVKTPAIVKASEAGSCTPIEGETHDSVRELFVTLKKSGARENNR